MLSTVLSGYAVSGRLRLLPCVCYRRKSLWGHFIGEGTAIACCLLYVAYWLLAAACCLLYIASTAYRLGNDRMLLPTAHRNCYCLLYVAYCLLRTVFCLLYFAYCLLSTAYCPLPYGFAQRAVVFMS